MSDAKQQVLAATDIVQLISKTVALKRVGRKYLGLCPFHQEKSASFNVNPERQSYYCFGCKRHGNAIDFVIERDRIEFLDAMRMLAEEARIELPRFTGDREKAGQRMQLIDAQTAAAKVFRRLLLLDSRGKAAREYLRKRGFTDATLDEFRVGYAADAWDALRDSPEMKPFDPHLLAEAGLLKVRENGGGHYDTFRDRVMFPIRDESGKTIAFGGRILPGSENPAKYLNSPETPLFSKSRTAYGLDLARQRIVESRTVVICEGYTDVLMAHQYDVKNVVSVLGTALTEQHVALLKRFADRIVLLFDADAAGAGAADRSLELFLTQPIEIAIATLPEGTDPDEVLLADGKPGFEGVIARATPALEYLWERLHRQYVTSANDLTGQSKTIDEFLARLASVNVETTDKMRLNAAIVRASKLTQIPPEELLNRIRALRAPKQAARGPSRFGGRPQNVPLTAREKAERDLIGAILAEPSHWQDVQKRVKYVDFATPAHRRLAEAMWDCYRNEGAVPLEEFLGEFAGTLPADLRSLAAEAAHEALDRGDPALLIAGCLKYLNEERARDAQRQDVAAASTSSDDDEITALLRRVQEQAKKPDLRRG